MQEQFGLIFRSLLITLRDSELLCRSAFTMPLVFATLFMLSVRLRSYIRTILGTSSALALTLLNWSELSAGLSATRFFLGPPSLAQPQKTHSVPLPQNHTYTLENFASATTCITDLIKFSTNFRREKGTQTQTFESGYLPVGEGSSTWTGGGQKVRYAPRNQGNQTFLAGYPGILRGYPGGARKVWEEKVCVQFWAPRIISCNLAPDLHGQNRVRVTTESLGRVIAAIRITSVRWRSYLPPKTQNLVLVVLDPAFIALRFESRDWRSLV